MKVVYTDVLVIGGGLTGLRLGIAARRRCHVPGFMVISQTLPGWRNWQTQGT